MGNTFENNNKTISLTKSQIKKSKFYCKKYGTSYFLASRFFPREKRYATWVLYAFFRIPDEIVDTEQKNPLIAKNKLTEWKAKWQKTYVYEDNSNDILVATRTIFMKYKIPFEYSISFLDAMIQDTDKTSYRSFDELKQYMFGSASVVGIMMSYVIGYEKNALSYAEDLGYAMQLTNFLRDIDEDYSERKRIYMPEDELKSFGLSKEIIVNKSQTQDWKKFLQFQIFRARGLYLHANKGIELLHKDGRRAVRLASHLYEKILDKIEQNNYIVWKKRAKTTFLEKIKIVIQWW